MARNDKLIKLVAIFDQFHNFIAHLDDPTAKRLVENWEGVRRAYVTPVGVPPSALAAGLEQGLRDIPMLLQSISPEARKSAAQALAEATSTNFPDFLAKDAERLAKIKARGSIRSENEYLLIRHQVDLLEGKPTQEQEILLLYELVEKFEGQDT